jgi:hypothetical protein
VCWGGEESLSISDFDFFVITDFSIGMTGNNLEEIEVGPNGRQRHSPEFGACHLTLMNDVLDSVNLDPKLGFAVPAF